MNTFNTTKIVATELENGKYRFEAFDVDGTKIVLREAGKLTKGITQQQPDSENPADQFTFNIQDTQCRGFLKLFTVNSGIEVIAYEPK